MNEDDELLQLHRELQAKLREMQSEGWTEEEVGELLRVTRFEPEIHLTDDEKEKILREHRELQSRLRALLAAGRTCQQIAEESGVPLEEVEGVAKSNYERWVPLVSRETVLEWLAILNIASKG